jgi:Mrp family chromosome partitioning ATPase
VRLPLRARPQPKAIDDLGGLPDGGLVVSSKDGTRTLHVTPSSVVTSLRFLLARAQRDDPLPSRLAVTSALRGEGVTFMTRSLASVLAYDSTESIIVVDLDWSDGASRSTRGWRRRAVEAPDAAAAPTLADVLEDPSKLDGATETTSNPRLHMISAGVLAPLRRSAVAGSAELEKAIDHLASRYDRVLLDLPPVIASSDAITLSHLADAYMLVVRHRLTTESQIDAALQELRGVRQVGVVINRFESRVPAILRRWVGS